MRVNIYYGGRGLIEDTTIYVMNKLTEVLEEIRVDVTRYNLYEMKNEIAMLPNTLKEADAVILAVHVEWLGIGGLMHQFLDACWLYGDKERIKKAYMMPLVISSTIGEKEAYLTLTRAWELLGGTNCSGICAYVKEQVEFETNGIYTKIIEKKAEDLYRIIKQKAVMLPSSTMAVNGISHTAGIELTPQESEQLSVYVSNDSYVKKQKEDIEELAQMFKGMLEQGSEEGKQEFVKNLKDNFKPMEDEFHASYAITLTDVGRTLVIEINNDMIRCGYGRKEDASVTAKTTSDVLHKLVNARTTFQGAFMSGALTAKGDFKILRAFDQLFQFQILS